VKFVISLHPSANPLIILLFNGECRVYWRGV